MKIRIAGRTGEMVVVLMFISGSLLTLGIAGLFGVVRQGGSRGFAPIPLSNYSWLLCIAGAGLLGLALWIAADTSKKIQQDLDKADLSGGYSGVTLPKEHK